MSAQQKQSRTLWTWVLAGAMGAAAAALFSPWTGKRTRRWISQKASHYNAESKKLARKTRARASWGAGVASGWSYKIKSFMNPSERADLDDDIITSRVMTALGENPLTWDLPRINVNSVENGIVTIRGPVSNVSQLHDVERVVSNVKGVKRVINDLRIAA